MVTVGWLRSMVTVGPLVASAGPSLPAVSVALSAPKVTMTVPAAQWSRVTV